MLKKIIVNIFFGLCLLFVVDYIAGMGLKYIHSKTENGYHGHVRHSLEETEADILIFGSSRALHHYVPTVFEDSLAASCYNTGINGNVVFYQLAVLKSVLKRHTPKVIFMDYSDDFRVRPDAYNRIKALLPYYDSHEEIRDIISKKSFFEDYKLNSKIYPYNSELFGMVTESTGLKKSKYQQGYLPLTDKWTKDIDTLDLVFNPVFDEAQFEAFKEFVRLAKSSGADFYVVNSPIYRRYNDKRPEVMAKEFCLSEGVNYIDFKGDSLFENSRHLFKDVAHLNHDGATVFSSRLAQMLKK